MEEQENPLIQTINLRANDV